MKIVQQPSCRGFQAGCNLYRSIEVGDAKIGNQLPTEASCTTAGPHGERPPRPNPLFAKECEITASQG